MRTKKLPNSAWPKVSVVIPAYNEEKFLSETLKSLKKQNYRGNFEVIVVDNGSTDKTAEIARKFGAKVVFEPQKGLPFARQAGFDVAKGDFIASTDADDILPSDWLTKMSQKLTEQKDLIAVGGWIRLKDGLMLPRVAMNLLSPAAVWIFSHVTGKSVLQDQNYMVKKWAVEKIDGYRGLDPMLEDLMLAQRLSTVGKVKLIYSKKWAVETSARRFNKGLIKGAFPYVLNSVLFALSGKLLTKNFIDIRDDKPAIEPVKRVFSAALAIILFMVAFLLIPINPVHAKIVPVTKRFKSKVIPVGKNIESRLDNTFDNNRHKLYLKYKHSKFNRR